MSTIEALLAARLFLAPQVVGDQIYFISNLSGRLSLYVMRHGGSVPRPLLPPNIALQNPELLQGESFAVLPALGQILVMIDADGDEHYQPMLLPIEGGFPQPYRPDFFADYDVSFFEVDSAAGNCYMLGQSRSEPLFVSFFVDLANDTIREISRGRFGRFPSANNAQHDHYILVDQFGVGDSVLYDYRVGGEPRLVYGVPLEQRTPQTRVIPSGIFGGYFTADERALIVRTVLFDDKGGLAILPLDDPDGLRPIAIHGLLHSGVGELRNWQRLQPGSNRGLLSYNIDGCDWVYETQLDEAAAELHVTHVLAGSGTLANGVLASFKYDKAGDRYALVFSSATTPTQLYTLEGAARDRLICHTDERILGIPRAQLAAGEDYSFDSHDGLRVSARLYLPAADLGHAPPYPLVYYIHGGPQSQERPDFAWFSMPLIQLLTLRGFAVFVPNVRGSTGYGFDYMQRVARDWGGQDRLDHVYAMTHVLARDPRIDITRAGVTGRSYGGYMTLMLAFRHPELWRGAVDMFGPYDLLTFADRVPETWKPAIKFLVGDPLTEADFLRERSPATYADRLACPLLVIQGRNDPRVWAAESEELVAALRARGRAVDLLLFENEGHDILKYENRVRCYNAIADFFATHLQAHTELT